MKARQSRSNLQLYTVELHIQYHKTLDLICITISLLDQSPLNLHVDHVWSYELYSMDDLGEDLGSKNSIPTTRHSSRLLVENAYLNIFI